MNRDGILDLVLAQLGINGAPATTVRLGNGDGTFQTEAFSTVFLQPLMVFDFVRDGKQDIVGEVPAGNGTGFGIAAIENLSQGRWRPILQRR
jgi:hypothetical protein